MKDILFLVPLYYTSSFAKRFKSYLDDATGQFTCDVYLCCSNENIFSESKKISDTLGFLCEMRPNVGGGEGALWFLQKRSAINLKNYKYIWYFEESCEPVSPLWVSEMIAGFESGEPVVGWDWHPVGRRRKGAVKHIFTSSEHGHKMVAFENKNEAGLDSDGNPYSGIWDTPGYRHETLAFRSEDFCEFDFPDASSQQWQKRNGVRTYGSKAERMWWDPSQAKNLNFDSHSPNIQWYVMTKHGYVPPLKNKYYGLFRELSWEERKDPAYIPEPMRIRQRKVFANRLFSIQEWSNRIRLLASYCLVTLNE